MQTVPSLNLCHTVEKVRPQIAASRPPQPSSRQQQTRFRKLAACTSALGELVRSIPYVCLLVVLTGRTPQSMHRGT